MHYQHPLLKSETEPLKQSLNLPDAEVDYWRNFIDQQQASSLFDDLVQQTEWRQERITIYGKTHPVPRLSCWMADDGLDYSYSNMIMHQQPWSTIVLAVKQKIEAFLEQQFNSVLLNYYRDGQDSNGWHADDEPELGQAPVIASLSLGAPRDFQLRHKVDKQLKASLALEHGSLLLMSGRTQACWQHHIPKRAKAEARINMTFRSIQRTI